MAVSRATALFVLALAAMCRGSASAGLLGGLLSVPLLSVLPRDCGYVYQVQQGDTCQSMSDKFGISLGKYGQLNPLALCGLLAPAPGALVCVGDKLATCSTRYRTVSGDTCANIKSTLGLILGLLSCGPLAVDTEVCLVPPTSPCDVDTMCGVSLNMDMRDMLIGQPDYCTIVRECQAGVTPGTTDGKPSVTLSLTEVTPAVSSVLNNDGHPELKQFAAMRSAGPTQMDVALVPAARADGSHASTIAIRSGSSGRRKLLAQNYAGQTGSARARYPYGSG